jgi:16S rRNA processing protein RimM
LPDQVRPSASTDAIALDASPYDTRAGIVVGAHGVQGTLKVKPITTTSSGLFTPSLGNQKEMSIWLGSSRALGRIVSVVSAKRQEPKGLFLVRLAGIDDRTTAEALVGQSIYGKSGQREPLSQDEYFVDDLIGLSVIDKSGQELGHLAVIHSGVAHDIYETDRGLLIPAVKAFIDQVDLRNRIITVVDAAALVIE